MEYEDVQLKLKKASGDQDKQGIILQLLGKQQPANIISYNNNYNYYYMP